MFRLSTLNVYTTFANYCDHKHIFDNLEFKMDDITDFSSATLYGNNSLCKQIAIYKTNVGYVFNSIDDYDSYMLNLKFKGYLNFSVLIRESKLRISSNIPVDIQTGDNIHEIVNKFVYMIIGLINENLNIDASYDYKILLMNGVLYKNHGLMNDNNTVVYLSKKKLWPVVSQPDFNGNRRRKGAIKLYINPNRKHGTLLINKSSFHFMGFVNICDIAKQIELLTNL